MNQSISDMLFSALTSSPKQEDQIGALEKLVEDYISRPINNQVGQNTGENHD